MKLLRDDSDALRDPLRFLPLFFRVGKHDRHAKSVVTDLKRII